jgi:hypothetical protein
MGLGLAGLGGEVVWSAFSRFIGDAILEVDVRAKNVSFKADWVAT